jgi:hypothetical protein
MKNDNHDDHLQPLLPPSRRPTTTARGCFLSLRPDMTQTPTLVSNASRWGCFFLLQQDTTRQRPHPRFKRESVGLCFLYYSETQHDNKPHPRFKCKSMGLWFLLLWQVILPRRHVQQVNDDTSTVRSTPDILYVYHIFLLYSNTNM